MNEKDDFRRFYPYFTYNQFPKLALRNKWLIRPGIKFRLVVPCILLIFMYTIINSNRKKQRCTFNPIFFSAEREGFEPPGPVKGQQFSRLTQSSTLPPLQYFCFPWDQPTVQKIKPTGIFWSRICPVQLRAPSRIRTNNLRITSALLYRWAMGANDSRVDRIRTCDNYIPNVAFYQLNYYPKWHVLFHPLIHVKMW